MARYIRYVSDIEALSRIEPRDHPKLCRGAGGGERRSRMETLAMCTRRTDTMMRS